MRRHRQPILVLASFVYACGGDGSGNDPVPDATVDATEDAADSEGADDTAVDVNADTSPDDVADAEDTSPDVAEDVEIEDDTDVVESPEPCTIVSSTGLTEYELGSWTVAVDEGDGAWRVTDAFGRAVIEAPPICVRDDDASRSTVRIASGEPEVINVFGSFQIYFDTPLSTISWYDAVEVPASVEGGATQGVRIGYAFEGVDNASAQATLLFELDGDHLAIRMESAAFDLMAGYLTLLLDDDEAFFGLGAQVAGLNLRGNTFPLWTQEQGHKKPENGGGFILSNLLEAAYAPMGIWHSTAGYTAIVGHDGFHELDLGETNATELRLTSYPDPPAFTLVVGDALRDRLASLRDYLGPVPTVPRWIFGPWNNAVGGPDRVEAVATILRDNAIPTSAMWTEDWIGGTQTPTGFRLSYEWQWSEETYPNFPERIEQLHADGFAVLGYFNTFVPETVAHYEDAIEADVLVETEDGDVYIIRDPVPRLAGLIDLSTDDGRDFMGAYMEDAAELGLDGWMADFTEWMPVDGVLNSGESAWRYHNVWPLDFQRLNVRSFTNTHPEGDEEGDWVFFPRSGWASTNGGSGGIVPMMWGGDQNTDFTRDDGMASVIPISTNLGLSGVALFGSDIAGYASFNVRPSNKELYLRWSAMGAFHPVMRTHHGSSKCDNWLFDRDQESIDHMGRYARLHTLLYPTLRRLHDEALATGLPVTRHPYLVEPDARPLWDTELWSWFIGDDIHVFPVFEPGVEAWDVAVAGEGWYPLLGDTALTGTTEGDLVRATVDAPVSEIPVFVRPGTALELLPFPVDSFYGATTDGITDLDDIDGHRALALYPTPAGGIAETTTSNGVTVSVTGLLASPDWSSAELDSAPLSSCDDSAPPCVLESGRGVRVDAGGELSVADATVSLSFADEGAVLDLVFAGAGFDSIGPVPGSIDLASDAPSHCE